MARYQVGFDGKWQEAFDDEATATEWAKTVGDTGRLVYVARRRYGWRSLIAVFPEDRFAEGKANWGWRGGGDGLGGPFA